MERPGRARDRAGVAQNVETRSELHTHPFEECMDALASHRQITYRMYLSAFPFFVDHITSFPRDRGD
eukprot:1217869-Pyramimonas_sp.AAC.1